MTTPSGLPLSALQYWGAARGAVANRVSTADFYAALNSAAASFGAESHGLSFQDVNKLRSAAVGVRNAADRFSRAPDSNAIDARMIGVVPYARPQDDRNALPIHQVGLTLHTVDLEGNQDSRFVYVRFTGQMDPTKGDLLQLVQQDAEQMAIDYGVEYAGHDVHELLAI